MIPQLQILGLESGSLRDPGQHSRSDLFIVVEGKDEVRPSFTSQGPVGVRLSLDSPADLEEGGQDSPSLGGWPDCSSGLERDVQEFGRGLSVLEALGDDSEG